MRISDWSSDVCSSDLSPAPPIAHPHTQMFAEAMRRHDLIIDDKELRLLLLGFQPLLHSSDGEGQITPRASEGVSCFRPLSLCLGFAVFRHRPIKGMELCCDVGTAVSESEPVQIAGPCLPNRLLHEPVPLSGVHRRHVTLLITVGFILPHVVLPRFPY